MNRLQTAHETLIPMLVELVGAKSYLELGTHANETIGKVVCDKRYGVDIAPTPCDGVQFFPMTTAEFLAEHAALHAPYDFVFIDADHTFDSVRQDYMAILPYVSPEGLILLHDTNPETAADTDAGLCGTAWALPPMLLSHGHECVTLPYHPGLTIIRNRKKWGPQ